LEIFYCEQCGTRVSETQVDSGEALVKGLAVYCPKCVRANPELQRLLLETSRSSIPAAKKRLGPKGSGRSTATALSPAGARRSATTAALFVVGAAVAALALVFMLGGGRSRTRSGPRAAPNVDPRKPLAPLDMPTEGTGSPTPTPPAERASIERPGLSLLTSLQPGASVEGTPPSPPQPPAEPAPVPAPTEEKTAGPAPSADPGPQGGAAWTEFAAEFVREGRKGLAEARAFLERERERLGALGLAERLGRLELRLRDAEQVESLAADSLAASRLPVRLRCRERPVSGKVVSVEKGKVALRPALGADIVIALSDVLPEEMARLAGLLVGESADPVRAAAYCLTRGELDAARSLLGSATGRRAEVLREELEELAAVLAPRKEPAPAGATAEPSTPPGRPEPPAAPAEATPHSAPRTAGAGLPQPLIYLSFDEGIGSNTMNAGSTAASSPAATLVGSPPSWIASVPPGGGSSALDFGTTAAPCGVDLPAPEELKGLKSFTITGWVNCRNSAEGGGGNRIVSWSRIDGSADGVDLVYKSDGSLQIGINRHPDNSPARSSPGKIPTDPAAGSANWRFFAVTYDETLVSGHVKFYFGTPTEGATLDCARDHDQGPLGPNIAPCVTIGNFVPACRTTGNRHDRMFRGLIDEIRIYGSARDGTGALALEEIAAVQSARGGVSAAELALLAPTPEERSSLVAECSRRPITDGFLLDPGTVVSLARRYAPERVVPRKIAVIGGSVAASQALDQRLRKELGATEGYVFATRVGLASAGATLGEIRKGVPRALDREKPELVRICPDLADALRAKGTVGPRADLAALIEAVQERGAVPVLYTLIAPRELGDRQAELQVAAFNAMVIALAIETKVPCVDAWRILNEATGAATFFRGTAPTQAGFDALAGRFLGLYRLLEKWVMRRAGSGAAQR